MSGVGRRAKRLLSSLAALVWAASALGGQTARDTSRLSLRFPVADVPRGARVSLPRSPDWMAIDSGSLWVVNYAPHRVSRIDPVTSAVVAEVPLDGKACLGIGVTTDRVWVPTCGDLAIAEIDLRTNGLIARRSVPIRVTIEGAFAIAGGSFWFPVSGPDSSSTTIARVDPVTGAIQRLIPTAPGSEAIVAGFGAVWVASSHANAVLRIDPTTSAVVARVSVGPEPKFMAVGEGALWVQNRGDGSVSRVDPLTNLETARIEAHAPTPYGDITVGDSAVWLAVDSTLITRIDPRTNAIAYQLTAQHGADAIRIGFGALWLADHERGSVWRVDLQELRQAARGREFRLR